MRPRTGVVSAKREPLRPADSKHQYIQVSSLPLNTPVIHCARPFSADVRRERSPLALHTYQRGTPSHLRQTLNVPTPTASAKPDLPYFIDPCIEQYTNLDLTELSSPLPPKTPSTTEETKRSLRYITHPHFKGARSAHSTNESHGPITGDSAVFNEINLERARINPIIITGTFPFDEDLTVSQSMPTRILSAPVVTAPSPYKNLATARSIPTITFPKKENNIQLNAFLDLPLLTVETSISKTPKRKIYPEQERLNLKLSYTPDILYKEPINEVAQRQRAQLKKIILGTVDDISIRNPESPHRDQLSTSSINSPQEQSVIKEQRGRIPSRFMNDREKYRSGYSRQLSHRSFTAATDIYSSESLALEASAESPVAKSHIDIEDDIKIFTTRASPFNAELSGRALGPGHASISCDSSSDTRLGASVRTHYLSVTSLSQVNSNDKVQKEKPSMLELLDNRVYPQKV